jgi:excisionase family DNA binding protein
MRMNPLEEQDRQLLTAHDIAVYLGVSVQTVYWWRSQGRGPKGMRIGRHLRFRISDFLEWLDEKTA